MATHRLSVYKYRLAAQQCSYMVDLSEGKISAHSCSVQPACWLLRSGAICLVVDKAAYCMEIIMTLTFFSVTGIYLTIVRGKSHKHTVGFLSVHAT